MLLPSCCSFKGRSSINLRLNVWIISSALSAGIVYYFSMTFGKINGSFCILLRLHWLWLREYMELLHQDDRGCIHYQHKLSLQEKEDEEEKKSLKSGERKRIRTLFALLPPFKWWHHHFPSPYACSFNLFNCHILSMTLSTWGRHARTIHSDFFIHRSAHTHPFWKSDFLSKKYVFTCRINIFEAFCSIWGGFF